MHDYVIDETCVAEVCRGEDDQLIVFAVGGIEILRPANAYVVGLETQFLQIGDCAVLQFRITFLTRLQRLADLAQDTMPAAAR